MRWIKDRAREWRSALYRQMRAFFKEGVTLGKAGVPLATVTIWGADLDLSSRIALHRGHLYGAQGPRRKRKT